MCEYELLNLILYILTQTAYFGLFPFLISGA